jgi:hypothetical protein
MVGSRSKLSRASLGSFHAASSKDGVGSREFLASGDVGGVVSVTLLVPSAVL